MTSLWLVCLSLIVAADAASLGGRSDNIPVQVVYDTPLRTIEDAPTDSRPVSVKNLDEKPQLSPEEIVEAEVLNIPVTIGRIAAQNIDEDVVEAIKVASESSSSDESEEDKSAEDSSEEESKEDETNEVNSDKNTLEGISKPVNQEQESVVPADIMPPISIVEVPVPDSLVPVMLPIVPDLIPPPLVAPEVVLVPEVQPEVNANNVAELEQQVELVQEANNLKSLAPGNVEQVVLIAETTVPDTNNKLVDEAANEELIEEVTKLKAMQEVDVPPKEIPNSAAAVPELYPQEQVNVVVQLRSTNPEVPEGNEQEQPVQASSTQAPNRPLLGLFNKLGENIGSALNNIRPSTEAAPAPPMTTADTNTAANVNNNSNRAGEEAAPPAQEAEEVATPTTAPPATNFLGGLQQNFNSQLNNFGNRFNGFIDNLRPKQPEAAQNGEEVTPPNTPILNTVQKQFNNGLQGFSDSVNNALNFINQNNQTTDPQKADTNPQNDEPSGQQPPNQFFQAISNGAQQFGQQFTNFVQSFTGQNQQQQQQQSDEQPPNPPNNATNIGQQVISIFQSGMAAFLQNFNRPNNQSTPTTQGDENPGAPPPSNNNGGFLGGIQNFANNIGQTFNNFISGGQNISNPAQGIPSQISQAGQQLANATQNIPGAQQIQTGISQIPGAQQLQNATQQGVEQIQNLQPNIPGAEQIQNLQQNIPGAEQIQNLQQNIPGAEQIQNLQQNIPGAQQMQNLQQNVPETLQEIIPSGKQIQSLEEKLPVAEEQNSEQVPSTEVPEIQNEEQAAEQIIEAVTQV